MAPGLTYAGAPLGLHGIDPVALVSILNARFLYLEVQMGDEIMTKRVALYLRVSTGEQTTENQRIDLERVAAQRGWDIVAIYDRLEVAHIIFCSDLFYFLFYQIKVM